MNQEIAQPMRFAIPPEQSLLSGLPNTFAAAGGGTLADWAALAFATRFATEHERRSRPDRLPDDLDTIALACLLLVADYGCRPDRRLIARLYRCVASIGTEPRSRYLDALPFDLCLWLLGEPSNARDRLLDAIFAEGSAVRSLTLDVAWLCRAHLSAKRVGSLRAVGGLLHSVSHGHLHTDRSFVLCRHMFPSAADFWYAVALLEGPPMSQQYQNQMAEVRQNPALLEFNSSFAEIELRVCREITGLLLTTTTFDYPPVQTAT
jgi:hypothetical protein